MKKILMCVPLLMLTSCELLSEGIREVGPSVVEVLPAAIGEVTSGNLVGAAYTVGTAVLAGTALWLRKRIKNSAAGEIIGGSNPA